MKLPVAAPDLATIARRMPRGDTFLRISRIGISAAPGGRYVHWDKLRHLAPPAELTSEQWWFGIKLARRAGARPLPIMDRFGEPFTYTLVPPALAMLHRIDQRAGGRISMADAVTNPATRDRYLVSSLIEEAITSSQLEGAATTRRVAKEMLRSGRPPQTKGERMILNTYTAMGFIRERRGEPLTQEVILDLHRILTTGTIPDDSVGRFQRPDEERVGVYADDGTKLHDPPPADELEDRIAAMLEFANEDEDAAEFLHPVLRAVVLHFWLAYVHPFEDGNGRTARALFYWAMLNHGYWLTEYISISRVLTAGPAKYTRSFVYTEQDENDATYFMLHQLSVIMRAIDDLEAYLKRKVDELRNTELLLRGSDMNNRQIALLGHALRNADATYTFQSHARSHRVVHQSARNDLLDLERRGYLERSHMGRRFIFRPVPTLSRVLRDRASPTR